jgi:diaminohydroxyphosphoribosylaminopyrimidine deaminase/5-amino-6-(5-phosphoribosylamino)uracil reductase
VYSSAVSAGIVDKLNLFMAPKILGGKSDKSLFALAGEPSLADVIHLDQMSVERVGDDILIMGYLPATHDLLKKISTEDT